MNRYAIYAVYLYFLHILNVQVWVTVTRLHEAPGTFEYCYWIIDHIFVVIDCETICKIRFFPRNRSNIIIFYTIH